MASSPCPPRGPIIGVIAPPDPVVVEILATALPKLLPPETTTISLMTPAAPPTLEDRTFAPCPSPVIVTFGPTEYASPDAGVPVKAGVQVTTSLLST